MKFSIIFSLFVNNSKRMTTVDLESIAAGYYGLTPAAGTYLLEHCLVTMKKQRHVTGALLNVPGSKAKRYQLQWRTRVTPQMERSCRDQGIATEHAAECLGILLAKEITNFEVIERSVKTTGFDYWLGKKEGKLFQKKAKLECAGRMQMSRTQLKGLFSDKIAQMRQSKHIALPGYAAVTGFDTLTLIFGKR